MSRQDSVHIRHAPTATRHRAHGHRRDQQPHRCPTHCALPGNTEHRNDPAARFASPPLPGRAGLGLKDLCPGWPQQLVLPVPAHSPPPVVQHRPGRRLPARARHIEWRPAWRALATVLQLSGSCAQVSAPAARTPSPRATADCLAWRLPGRPQISGACPGSHVLPRPCLHRTTTPLIPKGSPVSRATGSTLVSDTAPATSPCV